MLTIGRLARASGVNLETIRYYERIGLLEPPPRTIGGHRQYDDSFSRRLSFIRRARELGFSLEDVRQLLELSEESEDSCADVAEIARAHLETVRRKITDLTRLEGALARAVSRCRSGMRIGDCAILEMLGA